MGSTLTSDFHWYQLDTELAGWLNAGARPLAAADKGRTAQ